MTTTAHPWRLCLIGFAALLSCVDRQLEPDPDAPRVRCAMIVAYITVDGETFRLQDSRTGEAQVMACTCTTSEQLGDLDFRELINELGYDACVEFVAREGYAVEDSSCIDDYETGYFGRNFGYGEDPAEAPAYCESATIGCGVR